MYTTMVGYDIAIPKPSCQCPWALSTRFMIGNAVTDPRDMYAGAHSVVAVCVWYGSIGGSVDALLTRDNDVAPESTAPLPCVDTVHRGTTDCHVVCCTGCLGAVLECAAREGVAVGFVGVRRQGDRFGHRGRW